MGDIIDTGLGIASTFDWISSAWWLIGKVAHRGGYDIHITWSACSMSGREIERMLRRQGITTWAPQIVAGTLLISVPKADAARACQILERAGVPIENAPGQRGTTSPAPRPRPTPQARRADFARRSRIMRTLRR